MVRYDDWPRRLSDYLKSKRDVPFEVGVNDCVMFAVKGVEALTGVNTYSDYEGYKTEEEANIIINLHGNIENLISKHFGHGHSNKRIAQRGDLALVKTPLKCIGLVDDSGRYIACISERGYVKIPLEKAWRIWSY